MKTKIKPHDNRTCTKENLYLHDGPAKRYALQIAKHLGLDMRVTDNPFIHDLEVVFSHDNIKKVEVQITGEYSVRNGNPYIEIPDLPEEEYLKAIIIYDRKKDWWKYGERVLFYTFSFIKEDQPMSDVIFRFITLTREQLEGYRSTKIWTKEYPVEGEPVFLTLLKDWSTLQYMKDYDDSIVII